MCVDETSSSNVETDSGVIADVSLTSQSVQAVLEELERNWGHCIALYAHGSIVFKYKTPADIDLMAVVHEPIKPICEASVESQFKLGCFEVSVYSRSFWLRNVTLMDHSLLVCRWLPSKFILHENISFREDVESICISPLQLRESCISYAEYTWLKAKLLLEKNEAHKSCKNVSHVFRVLELSAQILEHGSILDFTAANAWWDRIQQSYTELSIGVDDGDLVEALWARCFQQEVQRVRDLTVAITSKPKTEQYCSQGVCTTTEKLAIEPVCSFCSESMRGESFCTLRCGHELHRRCALEHCRAAISPSSCPTCHVPWRLDLKSDAIMKREAELRGRWKRVRRHRRRYRPEVLLNEPANECADGSATWPEVEEVTLALAEAKGDVKAISSNILKARDTKRAMRRALFAAKQAINPSAIIKHVQESSGILVPSSEITFDGYPACMTVSKSSVLRGVCEFMASNFDDFEVTYTNAPGSDNEEGSEQFLVLLTCTDNLVVGSNLAGDEVFRLELMPMVVGDLREPIATALGFDASVGSSIELLDGSRNAQSHECIGDLGSLVAVVDRVAHFKDRFMVEFQRTRDEMFQLSRDLDEHCVVLDRLYAEKDKRVLKCLQIHDERKARLDVRLRAEGKKKRRKQAEDAYERRRLTGITLRRQHEAVCSRSDRIQKQREQSRRKSEQRLANLVVKEQRLHRARCAAHGAKPKVLHLKKRNRVYGDYELMLDEAHY